MLAGRRAGRLSRARAGFRLRAWPCSQTWTSDLEGGRRLAEDAIASGAALRALEQLMQAQGGDPRVAEAPWDVLEAAPVVLAVPAPRAGAVARCGALAIGRAACGWALDGSARRTRSTTP